jgi:hypothetical protein
MEAPAARLRWTYGTVAIVSLAMASVIQSCAVMTSSADCTNKADCPDNDASGTASSSSSGSGGMGASDSGSEGSTTPVGDDGGDATLADVSSEASSTLDAPGDTLDGTIGDATMNDVTLADVAVDTTSEDSTARDVVSEPPVDAPKDVAPDGTGPTGDGCIATVEDCTNGIDDTCDGKIDCADPACSGFTCATQVPAGWTGPALLWVGGPTATPPACPTGYGASPIDGHEGPTGTADTCVCMCTSGGQVCAATGTFHNDQACSAAACVTGAVSSASTACTNLASNICGTGGSFEINNGGVPTPTGGSCTPQVTITPGSTEGWTSSARICSWNGANDTPGGCNPTTDQCVGGSPGTVAGFAATVCVFQSGEVACPAGYPNNRNVVFSGEMDGRTCAGCTCTTASPSGGSCSGTVNLFGVPDCGGTPVSYSLGTHCLTYNNIGANDPESIQAALTVVPGTCGVAMQAAPVGAVTGTGPTTVCCM